MLINSKVKHNNQVICRVKNEKTKYDIIDEPIDLEEIAKIESLGGVKEMHVDTELQILPTYFKPKKRGEGESDSQRDIFFVSGPSGCGKTTFCCKFALEYKKMYPKNQVIYISPNIPYSNPLLKKLDPIIFNLEDPNVLNYNFYGDDPITYKALVDSLVIFDDLEGMDPKHVKTIRKQLLEPILTVGRQYRISVMNSRHLSTARSETQVSHLETNYMVFFPKHEKKTQLDYCLRKYGGLDTEDMNYIYKQRANRVCIIHKKVPYFFMGEKYIKI